MIMELVLRDLIKSWLGSWTIFRWLRFAMRKMWCWSLYRCLLPQTMVSEVIEKLKEVWPDCWCTEDTLDEFSEDDRQKHHGGMDDCGVGGSSGVCGMDGVSGRECKTCDRTPNSSSQQMSGRNGNLLNSPWLPRCLRSEHCNDYDCGRPSSGVRVSGRRSRHKETKLRVGAREWWRMLLE